MVPEAAAGARAELGEEKEEEEEKKTEQRVNLVKRKDNATSGEVALSVHLSSCASGTYFPVIGEENIVPIDTRSSATQTTQRRVRRSGKEGEGERSASIERERR